MVRRQRLAAALKSAWPGSGPTALEQVMRRRSTTPDGSFQPLPDPVGPAPYRRALADVLGPETESAIALDGALRFHCVGDTGGHRDPRAQRWVAAAMTAELVVAPTARFFYHLGDVVYPHGEEALYRPQFFSAYADYAAPIFAVPGNHDAEPGADAYRLEPFVKTFCSRSAPLHDAAEGLPRAPVEQPNVYWTLVHDWVWIVGLYTNVPEGGQLAEAQLDWLVGELAAAPPDVTLILAMHQPVYSADVTHGSNLGLADTLDACFERAGRGADAVFTGHSHSYQRFARRAQGREIPYVVAGAGGYPELHTLGSGLDGTPVSFPGLDGVTLEAFEDAAHGFMSVTAGPGGAEVVYSAVTEGSVKRADSFAIGPPSRS
jgi:predicted phosphodiesterase